jgi:two-component sensor histidine kinase
MPFRPVSYLAIAMISASALSCAMRAPPKAAGGVLDLRSWDFEADGPAALSGEWDFFPGELLAGDAALSAASPASRIVPDFWAGKVAGPYYGTGSGTYRLRLLLPEKRSLLGLGYTTVSTAFELEAPGTGSASVLAGAGRISLDPASSAPAYKPGIASLPELGDSLCLVVRVSNYEYRIGGMWRPFVLGSEETLRRGHWVKVMRSLALAAALVVMAAAFSFFIANRAEGKGFACFAAFAVITALRTVATGEYAIVELFPALGFAPLIRLEYLSAFTAYPLVFLFYTFLFPDEAKVRETRALLALAFAFLLLLPFAPMRVLTWSVQPFYVLGAVFIAVVARIQIAAIAARRPGAIALLAGSVALCITGINDMLFSSFLVTTGNLFPYGMLIFVGTQAYVLAQRYRLAQTRLREALAEKDLLFKEVHHRVKNSLQIVSSVASLEAHRSGDPAVIAVLDAMRDRIRAISLAHERLYTVEEGATVDAGAYIRGFVAELSKSYGQEDEGLDLEAESVMLPAGLCIDIGLALTELVGNARKHGSPTEPGKGRIRIRFRREGEAVSLRVEDDGMGFPEGFELEKANTLGARLISSLAKKNRATVTLGKGAGASVKILFPAPVLAGEEFRTHRIIDETGGRR